MSVRLFQFPHSPYCIPIAQVLRAARVELEEVEVSNADRSEILRVTAGEYFQVPVLEHGGRLVYESGGETLDVARYVDAMFCEHRLFPSALEGIQAILLPHLEGPVEDAIFRLTDPFYIADLTDPIARGLLIRHKERRYGRGCVQDWHRNHEALRLKADALLAPLQHMIEHSAGGYLLGAAPVYADFALFGLLGNLTFRGYNSLTPGQAPLGAWYERICAWRF